MNVLRYTQSNPTLLRLFSATWCVLLALGFLASAQAQSGSTVYFTISDIGEPYWTYPGVVDVGENILQVEILARKANGNRDNGYNGDVNLSQHTDYGVGRIEPAVVSLEAGKWKGTIQIFRAGKKQPAPGVTGDVWVHADDGIVWGESNRFCANPGAYNQLLTLAPGETHLPGSLSGKTGAPVDQQGFQPFVINVYATDAYWNDIPGLNRTISFSSSDPAAGLPGNQQLTNGALTVAVTLNSNGDHTITATDANDQGILPGLSAPIHVFSFELDHFEFNVLSDQTAGQPFSATITAVDLAGNPVNDYNGVLDLDVTTGIQTITPQRVTMVNGFWTGEIQLNKAAGFVAITAHDRATNPHSGVSNQFAVNAGALSQLQVLLPGETATPGITPGKSGTPGNVLAGSSLAARVNAVDDWWNVISSAGDIVHLTSSDPQAGLPGDAQLVNGTRQFVVTFNQNGAQTITAHNVTQPQVAAGTSSPVLVNPGNLHHFEITTINGPVTAGLPFSVAIRATDEFGNTLSGYAGSLTLSASTGANTINPVSINMTQGVYNGNIIITRAIDGAYFSVSDGANPAHTGNSNQFNIQPGTLAKLQVLVPGITATPGLAPGYTGTPQDQKAGQPFPILVNGVDTYWNVVSSAADSFGISSTDLLASLPQPTVLVNGSRNMSITLNGDGAFTVSAYHLNNTQVANGQSPNIAVIPQNLDHFVFDAIASPVEAGQPFQVTLHAKTALDETVVGFQGFVQLSASSGNGTFSPSQVGPFNGGVWTGELTLTRAAAGVSITAKDDALPPHEGTANPVTVVHGPFQKLQVLLPGEAPNPGIAPGKAGTPQDQFTGTQFDLQVRAVDAHWNLVNTISDSIRLTATDPLAQLPEKSKLNSGQSTLTAMMGSAGIHTISASDIDNPAITAYSSSSFQVNPGTLDHFKFETIADQVAGEPFPIQISAVDLAGNTLTGFNGHARLQSNTSQGTFTPTDIEFVDGVWTGNATLTMAISSAQLTCMDFAATPHTGESNAFAVIPGSFTKLQILLPGETNTPGIAPGKSGTVANQTVGDVMPVTVNAVDNWWNPITTVNETVGLTSSDPLANLPLDAQLVNGTVSFNNFRFLSPGFWSVTALNRTHPQISSDTSPLVHVITGSVASFMFAPISSPQIAGDTLQITVNAVNGNGDIVTNYNETASMTASTGLGTIQAGNIQFTDGTWSGTIILTRAAQSVHLNIHDFNDIVRGNSNPFTLLSGALKRLQVLLPGETATPGLSTGKSGDPFPQILGIPFDVIVRATDSWFNLAAPDSLPLQFSASDPLALLSADTTQSVASAAYTMTLLSIGNQRITVTSTNPDIQSDTSTDVYIQSGQLDHFVFSTIADSQVAGQPFTVRIEARNALDNPVTDFDGEIILSASTGNGTLSETGVLVSGGFWEGDLSITRADSAVVLYAADYIPAPNTHTGFSNAFSVQPSQLSGLQVLLPGETVTAGVQPGKKGLPEQQIAGNGFQLTVRAVDDYWNLIETVNDSLALSVSDSFAVIAERVMLDNGQGQFPVTLRAAGSHQFSAKFIEGADQTAYESEALNVSPNQFTQLLTLMPGEAMLPGDTENNPLNTPGRRNSATLQTSGIPFTTEVIAVDDYWNAVTDAPTDSISLYTTDNTAVIVADSHRLENGNASFSVTLNQGGNQIVRAIDESSTSIRTSLDGLVEVLVGGLHYELFLSHDRVAAGDTFEVQIAFKNGIGENVSSANHLVHLSLVSATDITQTVGALSNADYNLISGQRTMSQTTNAVGSVRIKVADDIGTTVAYSDPFTVFAGRVAGVTMSAPETEVQALEEITLQSRLTDEAGNAVPDKEIRFSIMSGTGTLSAASAISDPNGAASVTFTAGRVTETNIIRAQADSIYMDFEITVNLTSSTLADGVPVNYPNPFGVEQNYTTIDYYLETDADVTLQIFDLFGNRVWTRQIPAGAPGGMGREQSGHPNSVIWEGINDRGQKVGSGGYILFARAVAEGKTIMNTHRKIAVIR